MVCNYVYVMWVMRLWHDLLMLKLRANTSRTLNVNTENQGF